MSNYSPNWSPGTPLAEDEKISRDEKEKLAKEMKDVGASDEDVKEFWEDDQDS